MMHILKLFQIKKEFGGFKGIPKKPTNTISKLFEKIYFKVLFL